MFIIVVLVSSFLLLISYFIYPLSLNYFNSKIEYCELLSERKVVVLIAAYNEEIFIKSTIESILRAATKYAIDSIIIGDDGSTDNTHDIIERFKSENSLIKIERFSRIGKPNIVNQLVEKYKLNSSEFNLIFIDANIDMHLDCIQKLNDKLNYQDVGIVGCSVLPKNELSNYESDYIIRENKIKTEESRVFNYTVGVFGACYAMKGELYHSIPSNYITDDLFHSFSAIESRKKILYDNEAKVYEEISFDISNEFRRKRRYAAGNFQILVRFWKLLIPNYSSIGFIYAYFFHKIIRWISPILFFGLWLISIFKLITKTTSLFSNSILIGGTLICLFMFIHYIFHHQNKSFFGKRLYYFFSMNLALLLGFFDYLKGIKTNVWERSERV